MSVTKLFWTVTSWLQVLDMLNATQQHGFKSPTGFGSQARLFQIAFEGLALTAPLSA